MKRRVGPDISVRVGAIVAVTLLHLPFIIAKRTRERLPGYEAALLVRFIDAEPSTVESPKVALELERSKEAISSEEPATSRRSPGPDASAPHERARVDWYLESASASRAAIDAIIRDESYRPLGPREKRFQIVEPKPPPPLFERPKHRSGDIAPNPMDLDSVWHNENCFTQLEEPVIPNLPRLGDSNVNPITCLFPSGGREPRGDLFEHLKKKRDKGPLPGETTKSR